LSLGLPDGAEVRSTTLDASRPKPSQGDNGRLLVPLMRSSGDDRLQAVHRADRVGAARLVARLFGRPELLLPSVDLPVSSLQWDGVRAARNMYSVLESDLPPQVWPARRAGTSVVSIDVVNRHGDDAGHGGPAATAHER